MLASESMIAAFVVAFIAGARSASIDCKETGNALISSKRCEYEQECHVHCKSACLADSETLVFGTEDYSLESSICKSALHDLRISSWNSSAWTVSLMLYNDWRILLFGSMRYGVTSDTSLFSQGYFRFTSLRIKEEVLDVTALHRDFIYNDNFVSRLECHGPRDRKITFDYSIKEVNFSNIDLHPQPRNGAYFLDLSIHDPADVRTNMFWCLVERSTLSNVGSPAMFYGPNANPTFLPQNYTVTASLNDSVTLGVQAVSRKSVAPTVTSLARVDSAGSISRGQDDLVSSTWNIPNVDLFVNGVYIAEGPGATALGKRRGVFRVIVRTCPHGIYGPSCNFQCPICQNGGVCHDIMGMCVCPPGFRGETCEEPCGDDYFGRECQHRCSVTNADKSLKSCGGILMCLPDPYGCSCGTGFHGPFCNETCPAHTYGADCKQSRICFCKKEPFCDIYTGTCRRDGGVCLQGWKRPPYCDTSYPLLKSKPLVSGISDREATIEFKPWTQNVDYGKGYPKEYRIEYRVANETWNTQSVKAVAKTPMYAVVLNGLLSYTEYEVRVLVVDNDGNYREHSAVPASFQTTCGTPRMPPENIITDSNGSTEIVVKWKNPGRKQWGCWSASVVLEIDGKTREFNLTQSGFTSVEQHRIPVKPYTTVSIRMALRTPYNKYSQWTTKRTATSAEDAPSSVKHVELKKIGAREVFLSWDLPKDANGVIRQYRIIYWTVASRLPRCGSPEEKTTEVQVPAMRTTANLTAFRPYTKYHLSVAAVTIRPGPTTNVTFDTTAAAPEGIPTKLNHFRTAAGGDRLTWLHVPCNLANGANESYYLELESSDPWETELRKTTAPNSYFTYGDLVPYTRYQAKVFAQNEAGRSPRHASLNFTTAATDPPTPTSLEGVQLSQQSVYLSWNSPYPPFGELSHYQLKYFKAADRHLYTERIIPQVQCGRINESGLKNCYTVEGLKPYELYFFSVRAKNKGTGYSPYSVELEVETKETPPGPPDNIISSEETEDSLKIEWEPPRRRNGILLHYKVIPRIAHTFNAMLTESWSSYPITLPTSQKPEFYLRGLFPGSTYQVCVQASTSAGFGVALCGNFSTKASAPAVTKEPVVGKITNNEVSLILTPVDFVRGPITGYYLLVVRGGKSIDEPPKLVNFSTAQDMRQGYYVAAHLTPGQLDKGPVNFVVGSGNGTEHFENPPLTDATPYRFGLVAESNFAGEVLYGYRLTAPVIVNTSSNTADVGAIIGGVAVILILIIVAGLLTRYRIRKKAAVAYTSNIPRMEALKENVTKLSKLKENSMSGSQKTLIIDTGEYLPMASIRSGGLPSKPVLVKQLRQHVIQAEAEGILEKEYMNLPKGQLHCWDIAKEPQNKPKNRDGCKLPYDHSRVILAPSPPGDSTDYINASYVRGYKLPRKYIATQGPKESTLSDFWRMVWQEGSYKIVMLTNLMEQEKTKCSQYWPETSKTYSNFTVTLMKTDAQVDFVVREFQVTLHGNTRRVVQFHFTAWPDHGVPLHPAAFRAFLGRIRDFLPQDEHPIIVHCSDGIGRTGAFVLVDSMLTQAEAEGGVDLEAQLNAMRQSRVDLVDSLEQYIFVYNILVEILCPKNHKLSIEEFVRLHPKLKAKFPATGKSLINLEFEELDRMHPPPVAEDFKSAHAAKNLTGDSGKPLLRATSDGLKTGYINSVYVDGYKTSKAYLVTQMPLLETIDDFWEILAGSRAVTLVTLGPLEDEAVTPIFWPDLKCAARYGDVTVEQKSTEDFQGVVVRTFLLTQRSGPPRILKQFHSQSWPTHPSVPSSAKVVLELLEHVERWQAQAEGTPVVVQCLDGCQHSGLYCVSAAICDQLQLEKELDVFRAVQNVRGSRAEFIVDSEQYAFCYEVALACVDSLHMYSSIE